MAKAKAKKNVTGGEAGEAKKYEERTEQQKLDDFAREVERARAYSDTVAIIMNRWLHTTGGPIADGIFWLKRIIAENEAACEGARKAQMMVYTRDLMGSGLRPEDVGKIVLAETLGYFERRICAERSNDGAMAKILGALRDAMPQIQDAVQALIAANAVEFKIDAEYDNGGGEKAPAPEEPQSEE